jgi:copper chaperone CopZ
MHQNLSRRTALACLGLLLVGNVSVAAEPRTCVIQVSDMHCANCAKKIARKLYAVPSVTKVSTNVKAGTATIVAQEGKTPSPKALWEAVEQAKFEPVKLSTPAGTYTKKPNA